MSFVWADNAFDEIEIDEWVAETGFHGTVRVTRNAVMLSLAVNARLREHTCPRTRDLRDCLSACLDALLLDARGRAAA